MAKIENFNRLSRVHERYRQTTDDRQTDGRRHIANMNMSSRSLKTLVPCLLNCMNNKSSILYIIFTALHVMQTRYCDENSVRPSVCLSVTRVDCDKTEERSV